MRISGVTVDVRNAGEAADFFGTELGLLVVPEPDAAVVQVGTTTLTLRENPETRGVHHLAFTIPSNKFAQAKEWVAERTGVMDKAGQDEFEYDAGWNARSLYFPGPDGSVLELIIRRDLGNEAEGDFTGDDLLCISEVGVAVPDVRAAVDLLGAEAGIEPYGLEPRDRFTPVGDIHGLVILVSPERTWFPADDRLSAESRILIEAVGDRPGTFALGAESSLVVRGG
jgi:catechol-2,3-dioxygenase